MLKGVGGLGSERIAGRIAGILSFCYNPEFYSSNPVRSNTRLAAGITTFRAPARKSFYSLLVVIVAAALACACRLGESRGPSTLVMAIEVPPITFDPRGPTNGATARIQQLIFNTLIQKDERFELVPELAEGWTVDPEFREYDFTLKRGVHFHDGREFSAEDVVYTFQTLMSPGFDSPKRAAFAKLDRVVARDRDHVSFHCRDRYRSLPLDLLAVGIIPAGSGLTIAERPVGTGPFRFRQYQENQEINLEASDDAFGSVPRVKNLRIRVIRDPTTLGLELLSGEVDLAVNTLLSPDFVEEERRKRSVNVEISDGATVEYLGVNVTDPILRDPRVRKALSLAIDRHSLIDALLRGQARVAGSVLPPGHWAADNTLTPDDYQPDRARALLDEAGWPDPDGPGPKSRFRIVLKTSSAEQARQIATILQEQLRLVGIDLELLSFEFQTFLSDINRGNFQLFFIRLVGGNQFPDVFKAAFGSFSIPGDPTVSDRQRTGFLNRARYRNPQLDRLIDESERTSVREEQVALYKEIQQILARDLPWIYLWYPANVAVMNRSVENVHVPASGDFFFIRNIELRH